MKIYWCHYFSGNFTFDAFGDTPDDAKLLFKRGIIKHTEKTKASMSWAAAVIDAVEPIEIVSGGFYRNNWPF